LLAAAVTARNARVDLKLIADGIAILSTISHGRAQLAIVLTGRTISWLRLQGYGAAEVRGGGFHSDGRPHALTSLGQREDVDAAGVTADRDKSVRH
jgi:hypothetical protein